MPADTDAPGASGASPPGGPWRGRHRSRLRDVTLLILWQMIIFIASMVLVWRIVVAGLPTLPMPANPVRIAEALAAAAVGGALIAGVILLYPSAGPFLLAVTAPLEEVLYVSVGSFRLKPYEAILLGLCLALLIRRQLRLDRLAGILAAYVLVGVVSVGLDIGAPLLTSLQVIAFEVLMVLLFMATRASILTDGWGELPGWLTRLRTEVEWTLAWAVGRVFLRSRQTASSADAGASEDGSHRAMTRARQLTVFYVLGVGNAVALYGLGQFIGYYLGLPIPYFHPEVYAIFRPYATFIEPNPFGTFLTAQMALALTLLISPAFRRWRMALVGTLALQVAVLAVNLSRGSWVATALVLLILAVIRFTRAPDRWRIAASVVGGTVALAAVGGAVLALWSPAISQALVARLSSITNLNDGTLHWRASDFLLALQFWTLKPVLGYGPGTWGAAAYGFVGKTAVVAPRNLLTAWLFERGLVGALLAIGFYKLLAQRAITAYQSAVGELHRTLLLAYGLATVAVFVGFLSASAEIVPYYWFQLGMLAALTDVALPMTKTESTYAHRT
jgi:O-antigen ligase